MIPTPVKTRKRNWLAIIGVALLALVVTVGGAGYLYLRSTLPALTGTVTLAGLQQPVTVYRDQYGIPHIEAQTLTDAFMAQGYVTAQDRLFQLEMARRLVSGRLSEVVGEAALPSDKWFRTLGLDRFGAESLALYPEETVSYLEAYAHGVNAFIAEGKLPPEFRLLGFTPAPWTPHDTLAVGKYMGYMLADNWNDEVKRFAILNRTDDLTLEELLPVYPAEGPFITGQAPTQEASQLPATGADIDWSATLAALEFAPHANNGSNNWALAGSRTRSGKPLLASDPHLGLAIPSQWHAVHIKVPGQFEVIGTTVPGVPGVATGHNGQVAWGMTSLIADSIDLYIERRNPDNPYEFEFNGSYYPAQVRTEEIKVKGQDSVFLEVVESRHGPIISEVLQDEKIRPSEALAWRWSGAKPSLEFKALLAANQAGSVSEWLVAMADWEHPALSWAVADVHGNIAYQATAGLPDRKQGDGVLPVPGWIDTYDWNGLIAYSELPRLGNPSQGYVYSANNHPGDTPYTINTDFHLARAQRIVEVLDEANGWTVADAQALQTDLVNKQAEAIVPVLLSFVAPEGDAYRLLNEWNYVESPDSGAALLYHFWYEALQEQLYDEVLGFRYRSSLVTDRLIREAAAGNEPRIAQGRGFANLVQTAFDAAVARATELQGSNPAQWQWGKWHRLAIEHPLGMVKVLAPLVNVGNDPAGGSADTVRNQDYHPKTGKVNHGAGYRIVIDLADFDNSRLLVFPGQSGHPLSPHYSDQYKAYSNGDLLPLPWHPAGYQTGKKLTLTP